MRQSVEALTHHAPDSETQVSARSPIFLEDVQKAFPWNEYVLRRAPALIKEYYRARGAWITPRLKTLEAPLKDFITQKLKQELLLFRRALRREQSPGLARFIYRYHRHAIVSGDLMSFPMSKERYEIKKPQSDLRT